MRIRMSAYKPTKADKNLIWLTVQTYLFVPGPFQGWQDSDYDSAIRSHNWINKR